MWISDNLYICLIRIAIIFHTRERVIPIMPLATDAIDIFVSANVFPLFMRFSETRVSLLRAILQAFSFRPNNANYQLSHWLLDVIPLPIISNIGNSQQIRYTYAREREKEPSAACWHYTIRDSSRHGGRGLRMHGRECGIVECRSARSVYPVVGRCHAGRSPRSPLLLFAPCIIGSTGSSGV